MTVAIQRIFPWQKSAISKVKNVSSKAIVKGAGSKNLTPLIYLSNKAI